MDRFKFRVFVKSTGDMIYDVYGFVIDPNKQKIRIFRLNSDMPDGMSSKLFMLNDVIVDQYISREDKNGVLIFEGSLMQFEPGHNKNVFEVFWCDINLGWMRRRVSNKSKGSPCSIDTENMVVVGNIHQNPELLT